MNDQMTWKVLTEKRQESAELFNKALTEILAPSTMDPHAAFVSVTDVIRAIATHLGNDLSLDQQDIDPTKMNNLLSDVCFIVQQHIAEIDIESMVAAAIENSVGTCAECGSALLGNQKEVPCGQLVHQHEYGYHISTCTFCIDNREGKLNREDSHLEAAYEDRVSGTDDW